MMSPGSDSPAALEEELAELEEDDADGSSDSSLDVVGEDEASSPESLGAGAMDLHVQVLSASSLTAPAYRPGDFARKLIFSESSLLQNVYVKVRVGRVCGATQQVACHDHSVRYEDASLVFPYKGEEEISIAVKNGRSKLLYGAWCGNPFIGEGRASVPKGSNESIVDVRLKRAGFDGESGVVSLKLQLVPAPQRGSSIERLFCLRLDRLSNANFNAISLSEKGPIGRRFYVKVQVFNIQSECVARAISHGVPDQDGFVIWDEVLTLPSHDNLIPKMHRSTFCTELSPSDWDLTSSTVKFSVYERNAGGRVFRDRCVGRAVIPLADLIEKPAIKFFISDSSNNIVVADSIPHKPLELSVFVVPTTMPSAWPKPTEEEVYSVETYPRHIFMLTRGTRGDVQPFVALARGMAEQLGWLVTICTELRWKDFIKSNSKVARGRIRFRVSGGDTEARMKSWISKFALSSKTEVIQMLIMANAEVEFFSSSTVFMHHVTNMQNEPKPVDLLVFGMTCAGIAGVISESLNIPLMGFFLQPSCIPSSDPSWTAVVPSQTGNRLADYVQEKVFTSHGTLTLLKKFTEHNPYSKWNLDEIRSWYGLPKADTWELFELLNVPIVIPIREGTFKRPDDWWQSIYLTDFIFLRQNKTAVETKQALDDPVLSFVIAAKAAASKLCLITFSSMPVPQGTMLSFVVKMLEECRFNNFRILYVGPILFGTVPPNVQTKVKAMKQAGRFLEAERADFGVLFGEIDCFIVHGGLGTTVEALRIGRPICVTGPLLLDQRFWGAVVAEKGIGPAPVHFEYFERGCVDFVNGALDPTDPLGWQKNAKDQMSAWGDERDDGVGANIALFASLLSTLGRHCVKVSLLTALGATATTSFFSLLSFSLNAPRGKGHVSVELRLGRVIKSSGPCPITMDCSADFSGVEPMIFPYNAEDGVVLTVREVHDLWIKGEPVIGRGIIGSGILPLSTEKVAAAAEDRKPHVEAVTISSKKPDKHSVTLMLQYEVVDCDHKVNFVPILHSFPVPE